MRCGVFFTRQSANSSMTPLAFCFSFVAISFRGTNHLKPAVRGNLEFLLNAVNGPSGAAQAMPDGRKPETGGWNQIQILVDDLEGLVDRLRKEGLRFRNEIVAGVGGKPILMDDPSGNPVEFFEPQK
mgnify:CR=1 FL=1|jgi:hypothetical protein